MEWKGLFSDNLLRGGQEYFDNNSVKNIIVSENEITGDVSGIDEFHVKIVVSDNTVKETICTCPLAQTGAKCKHMAAVLVAWENRPGETETINETEIAPPTMFGEEKKEEVAETENKSEVSFTPNYDGRIELNADINTFFSYALQQNRVPVVRTIAIKNTTDSDIDNLSVRIWTDLDFIDTFVEKVDTLAAGEGHSFRNLKIIVHGDFLASLTERISCNLYVSVTKGTEELARQSEEITVLAFDQWPGSHRYYPDLLTAFITPNHPAMATLLQSASKYLEKWTGDPSIDGYQSDDPNRILAMAGAAYAAIQEKNITYSNPPASLSL